MRGFRSAGTISPLHEAQDGLGDLGATTAHGVSVSVGEATSEPRDGVGREIAKRRLDDGQMANSMRMAMVWTRVN